MDRNGYENGCGIIVALPDLKDKLSAISHGLYQWRLVAEPETTGHGFISHVDIAFSNPEFVDMPNDVCFRFPVFDRGIWRSPELLVCMHPSLAEAQICGLYFEGDRLLNDNLEDFYRFWTPLREVL